LRAFEVGWPLGFKLSQTTRLKWLFVALAILSMALSGFFLWLAQREIPIGTAYAVSTGSGVASTFPIGIAFFADPAGLLRILSFLPILAGVLGLKLSQ